MKTPQNQTKNRSEPQFFRGLLIGLAVAIPMWLALTFAVAVLT
jgi:hypothetical protein